MTAPSAVFGVESTATPGGFDVGQIPNAGFNLGTGGPRNVRSTRRIVKARRPKRTVAPVQSSGNSAAAFEISDSATTGQIPYAGFGMGHGGRTRQIVKAHRPKHSFNSEHP